jgi:hypothetical protein
MSTPCKIVTLTSEERDTYRKLRDEAALANKAFAEFQNTFQLRNAPQTRRYAPFETVEMTILDAPDPRTGGTAHAYFTKELE